MNDATARARVLAICEHLIRDGASPNVMLIRGVVKLRKTTVAAILADLIGSGELRVVGGDVMKPMSDKDKVCKKCGTPKPRCYFGENPTRKGEIDHYCLECRRLVDKRSAENKYGYYGHIATFEEEVEFRIAEMRAAKQLAGEPPRSHAYIPTVYRLCPQ